MKQKHKLDLSVLKHIPLFPYQKKGIQRIEAKGGRALLADDMGLGKTLQALAWLKLHPELRPALIICPASLKLVWEEEWHKWRLGGSVAVLDGLLPFKENLRRISIINYELVGTWLDVLLKTRPKLLIIDEVHYIKNKDTLRSIAVSDLCRGQKHIIGISGTPITNRPIEFFPILNTLAPRTFPSYYSFAHRYCGAKSNGFGWDFTGSSNTDVLHKLLTDTVMIRRRKKDVLKYLPPKIRAVVPLGIDRKIYKRWMRELATWLYYHKGSNARAMVEIGKTKRAIVHAKLKNVCDWIRNYLESGNKLVVFAIHYDVIDILAKEFKGKCVVFDGRVNEKNRQKVVRAFQNDEKIRLFIGNIRAAGVGLTLTAAPATAFVEMAWTPGEMVQAEDRVHRIGQTADSVMAYYLIAHGTFEEDIAAMLDKKAKILSAILDGKVVKDCDLLKKLINKIKKGRY